MEAMEILHERIRSCRLCEEAGYIEHAAPVVCEPVRTSIMLIGQAPGQVEFAVRRPFQGRAGRELFRWMESIGIGESEFRERVYMTSITKCFPGKAASGSGDRRPSSREIGLCRPWLEYQLGLQRPRVVLLVGGLAIDHYFPKMPLTALIGHRFDMDGTSYVPLPHPSGASRWLNVPANRSLLRQALTHVRAAWDAYDPASGAVSAAS